MKVTINDKEFCVAQGATLSEALQGAGVALEGVAVAVGGSVVPRGQYAEKILQEDDKILIIKAFYGG